MCTEDMRCCICKEEGHLAIDCQHSWYRRPPPSLGLSPETVADDPVPDPTGDTVAESSVESAPAPTLDTVVGGSGPASTAEEPSSHAADTEDTCPSQPDAADLESQPDGSVSAPDLDSQVPLFSGDQPSPSSEAAVPAASPPADTFVPSVSDSTLGRIPSASEDPVPSVTDSALAEVEMPHVSEDPVPSVSDSTLAEVDLPLASVDLAPSVSDSALAQVPSPSDAPALDLTPPMKMVMMMIWATLFPLWKPRSWRRLGRGFPARRVSARRSWLGRLQPPIPLLLCARQPDPTRQE